MRSEKEETWRLILSQAVGGAENMALDEAILEAVSARESPPTLRLYAWQPACLSLGHAQPIADVDSKRLKKKGWDLVRRPTGGRAILHSDELTYAVIAPDDNPHVVGGVLRSYQHLSAGLAAALIDLQLPVEVHPNVPLPEEQRTDPVCFHVPSAFEITVHEKKLIGSAQLRRRGGVLQHGTIPLLGDITRICQVLHYPDESARIQATQRIRELATTVEALLGNPITWQQAAHAVIKGFTNALGLQLEPGTISEAELARSATLISSRYNDTDWTNRH